MKRALVAFAAVLNALRPLSPRRPDGQLDRARLHRDDRRGVPRIFAADFPASTQRVSEKSAW